MKKEINYGGFSANRSDYESQDGELAVSMGLVNEEGQLRHILEPKSIAELPSGYNIVYIHKTSYYTHYIIQHTFNATPGLYTEGHHFYWIDETDAVGEVPLSAFQGNYVVAGQNRILNDIHKVDSIGNTLIILSSSGMHYVLWKAGSYKYLGTHIPELPLSFGLHGNEVRSEEYPAVTEANAAFQLLHTQHEQYGTDTVLFEDFSSIQHAIPRNDYTRNVIFGLLSGGLTWLASGILDGDWSGYGTVTFEDYENLPPDTVTRIVTANVLAKVNKFISEEATEKNKFIFPFFVRYAYKLYDETYTMQSSPVLMIPASEATPHVYAALADFKYKVCALLFNLDYLCIDNEAKELLREWSDIVKSVDIFISAPIYTYNLNGNIIGVTCDDFSYTVSKNNHSSFYTKCFEKEILMNGRLETSYYQYILPRYTPDQVNKKICDCHDFYKISSIELDNIATANRTVIELEEDSLKKLVTKDRLTDDYNSHDTLVPKTSFVYNSRFNIANISKKLAKPLAPIVYAPYTDDTEEYAGQQNVQQRYDIQVFINEGGREFVLMPEHTSALGWSNPFRYFYYPNANAYKVLVHRTYDVPQYQEIPLKKHEFLNGAYFFEGFDDDANVGSAPADAWSDDEIGVGITIPLINKLYSSLVDNPFYFPVENINTIGTGQILALSAATKALSQGQLGQFPLYVFTTEGIWYSRITDEGLIFQVVPGPRDVLLDPESLCQIDTAVLFATDRGIMIISGSETQCLSDVLLSDDNFDPSTLPRLSELSTFHFPLSTFQDFLHGCRMVYDYLHQRIVLFNPTTENSTFNIQHSTFKYPYAYVFSLKSKLWGMTPTTLRKPLNSYPEALAMTRPDTTNQNKGHLVTLSDSLEGTDADHPIQEALLVTRPLKLGDPNLLKTVHTLVQRGMFRHGSVKSILYGSRDLFNWHLVASSRDEWLRGLRGTPYKYFRIAILATLDRGESVSGATVEFEPRHTDRIH